VILSINNSRQYGITDSRIFHFQNAAFLLTRQQAMMLETTLDWADEINLNCQ
jgi:hypothetical protein